jgi:putative aminopeptidase FrvX
MNTAMSASRNLRRPASRVLLGLLLSTCVVGFAAVSTPAFASSLASPHLKLASPSQLKAKLEAAPYSNARREATLQNWFEESGCGRSQLAHEVVTRGQPSNLICDLKGQTASLIIVSGHMDHVRRGMGVVDDWSGASMLPSLYQALASLPRKHTFLFIGFTEEEKGLVGSRFYVRHLAPEENRKIRAMVNLECLGLSTPKVWSDHAAPALLSGLFSVARNLQVPLEGIDLERVGRDDAESFRARKVPTITIHSLTQDTIHIMHTRRDNFAAVNMTYYDESYRLVSAYLAYLDTALP